MKELNTTMVNEIINKINLTFKECKINVHAGIRYGAPDEKILLFVAYNKKEELKK
jgi:hypothetical protein